MPLPPEKTSGRRTRQVLLLPALLILLNGCEPGTDFLVTGNAKSANGDPHGAIADYTESIKANPGAAEAYYNRGCEKQRIGDLVGAMDDYVQAITLKPDHWAAYNNLGYVKLARGYAEAAIMDFSAAIHIKPDYALAYKNRANARLDRGDRKGALADLNLAIKADPQFALAYALRGDLQRSRSDWDDAIKDYTRALNLESVEMSNVLTIQINNRLESMYVKSDEAAMYAGRGLSKAGKNDWAGAIEDYNSALGLQPKAWQIYTDRGDAKQALGDRPAALADFARAEEIKATAANK